jgi:hypothetical protein
MAGPDAETQPRPGALLTPRRLAALTLLLVLALGGLSLRLGQDVNFDLLNYHYYTGYAFLHGRTFEDVAPAGSQTFQPPLMHAFHYLGIAHLPPRVFGFLLGAIHGLNLPLVLVLGLLVLGSTTQLARGLSLLAAVVGCLGPAAVSLLGTTFGDNLVSIPALGSLALVLWSAGRSGTKATRALLAAGLLTGAAAGLKLTMAAYAIGLAAAVALLAWPKGAVVKHVGLLAAGGIAGFLPTAGFWDFQLWRRFGNPLFPFANATFRSEWQSVENFRDTRYMVHSAYDLVRPFVDTALGRSERLIEIGMRDVRYLLLLAAFLACAGAFLAARAGLRPAREPLAERARALLAFWAASYLAWALAFYTYRYAALLELTAPLLLFVLLSYLIPDRRALAAAATGAALLVVSTASVESWGRRPWQTPWLGLPVPALGLQPDSLFLMVGQPSAYAIPSFREDARFVHLTAVERFQAPAAWNPLVERTLRDHRGPLLLLSNFEFSRAECEARADALGLRHTARCEPVRNGALRFRLCELERK